MAYNYNNFLRPISPTDRNIQVLDSNGTIRYTVNPFAILNTMVNNNVVKINLKNDKLIILDFYTPDQAKGAIDQLQKQIDALIQNVPNVIDKEIENFVEKYVNDVNFIDPIGGSLRINGNILPRINNTYNLGSSQSQWHSLYVGPQSLFVGGVTISSHNGSILINSLNLGSTGSPARLSASSGTIYTQATFSSGDVVVKGVTISSHNGSILFNSLNLGSVASPMILNSVDGYMTTTATMSMGGAIVSGVTISGYNNSILIDSLNLGSTSSPVTLSSENGTIYTQATFSSRSIILDNDGDIIREGNSVLYRYSGTSSTPLQLPETGYVVNLQTQNRLGFEQGQSLIVYSVINNNYMIDDYADDDSSLFVGEVSGYNFSSGLLELVVTYSPNYGLTNSEGIVPTYSHWTIATSPTSNGASVTNPVNNAIVTSDGSTGLLAHNNLTFDDTTFYIQATTQFQQTIELVNPDATYLIAGSPSAIQYGFTSSGIWYHSNLNSDYTASFLGVPTYSNRVITATIVIAQGATAYLPTSLTINEDIYSIKWSNATLPSGTPNKTDIVGFSFINIGGTFSEVLGNISTFGLP